MKISFWLLGAALIIFLIIIAALGYVKAPPDKAFIISGLKKEPKILIGRSGIRIPFLERLDRLYLGQMTVDIKTGEPVPTNDFTMISFNNSCDGFYKDMYHLKKHTV